jgi:hypothetical protein
VHRAVLRGSHRLQRRHPYARGLVPNGSGVGRLSLVAFVHRARGSGPADTFDLPQRLLDLHQPGAAGCCKLRQRAADNEPFDPADRFCRVRESSVYTRRELPGSRAKRFRSTERLFSLIESVGDARAQVADGFANPRNRRLEGLEEVFGLSKPFVEAQVRIQEDASGDEILGALERLLHSRQTLIYTQADIVKLCQRQVLFRGNRVPCPRYLLRR